MINPLNVNGDSAGFVTPIDALLVINELNGTRHSDPASGRLPRQVQAEVTLPYLDVSCDGFVSPLDALIVINYLNSNPSQPGSSFQSGGGTWIATACSPQLLEGTGFTTEFSRVLTLPDDSSAIRILFEAPDFDTSSKRTIRDAFEIAITDLDGNPVTWPYSRDQNVVYNWTEDLEPIFSSTTRTTTAPLGQDSSVIVDLAGLPALSQVRVTARLVNNDFDNETSVIVRGIEVVNSASQYSTGQVPAQLSSSVSTRLDFSVLSDVTSSVSATYKHTSFDDTVETLVAEVALFNEAGFAIDGPIVMAIKNITNPSVGVGGNDGYTPDGAPYFDFTRLIDQNSLDPGDISEPLSLFFHNPTGERFGYDLVVYGQLNRAPIIESTPIIDAQSGRSYIYDVEARDPDGDQLDYQLTVAPSGMTIDRQTGLIHWQPTMNDNGSHVVEVDVYDGRNGRENQVFSLSVWSFLPNRPPVFTSVPPVNTSVNASYEYLAKARDPDGDSLSYSLLSGPDSLTIDSSGLVNWNPLAGQVGTFAVALQVDDGHGGLATQSFQIQVAAEIGNGSPYFVSDPLDFFHLPAMTNPSSGNVAPVELELDLPPGESIVQSISITLPPDGGHGGFADIVLIVDESGSMVGEHAWLAEMVLSLEAQLAARGIGPNRYGLVGFGGIGDREPGHVFYLADSAVGAQWRLYGPAGELVSASNHLEGIDFAVTSRGTHTLVLGVDDNQSTVGEYDFRFEEVAQVPVTSSGFDVLHAGTITSAHPSDVFHFQANAGTEILIDVLASRSATLTLEIWDPEGNSLHLDALNRDLGIYALPQSGEYTIEVKGITIDDEGDYAFRVVDLSQSTTVDFDQMIQGKLESSYQTTAFHITGQTGKKLEFVVNGNVADANFRLIGPDGRTVVTPGQFADFIAEIQATADYVLLVESMVDNLDFAFTVSEIMPAADAIVFGNTTKGVIDTPGVKKTHRISIEADSLVYVDSLTADIDLLWSLTGPRGEEVVDEPWTRNRNNFLALVPGDYRLTVQGSGDATGGYAFRVLNVATASLMTPGMPVSGVLEPGNLTHQFQLNALAGEQYYFDVRQRASGEWRLFDPYGGQVFGNTFGDVETIKISNSGRYTLLVEGRFSELDSQVYSINVQPVVNSHNSLTLGETISDRIGVAGEQDTYSFTLASDALVTFDSLLDSELRWSLSGPRGEEVNNERLGTSDARNSNSVLRLVAGDYQLTIDAIADGTGDYAFRLLDLSSAVSITTGTEVSGSLIPGNQTHLYQLSAQAGDQFTFDAIQTANGYWRLVDPYGRQVFSNSFSVVDMLTAPVSGVYTLMIEGQVTTVDPQEYSFGVQFLGNNPPTSFSGTPLSLGDTVQGSIVSSGEQDGFTFTLASDSYLLIDSLTNNSQLRWSVVSHRGGEVTEQRFDSLGAGAAGYLFSLVPGDYQLIVRGIGDATGDYGFRLLDLASATLLTPAVPVSGTLDPGNQTHLYQFNALVGEQYFFDVLQAATAYWRLVDPYGGEVWGGRNFTDQETLSLPASGIYTLVVEGRVTENDPQDYSLNVQRVVVTSEAITLGSIVGGSIGVGGEFDEYRFTLATDAQLVFDSLTNSSLRWSLIGPRGDEVVNRRLDGSDAVSSNYVLSLVAGDYLLTVDGSGDATGDYAFRLLDLASAVSIVPGTILSGTLNPGNATHIYEFQAEADDLFYFDALDLTNGHWRLLDEYGGQLFSNSLADVDTLSLPHSGRFTLLVEGSAAAMDPQGYVFNVQPIAMTTLALTLGDTISESISVAGERDAYTFTLASDSYLAFDALTNTRLLWNLFGPRGDEVLNQRFDLSDSRNANNVLSLVAGDYLLTVDGSGDASGDYAFRLLDLATGSLITPATPVSGTLDPGSQSHAYRLAASAGDQFFFDVLQRPTGFWRLIDPFGNQIFSNALSDVNMQTLPVSGDYTLLVEGRVSTSDPQDYSVKVEFLGNDPPNAFTGQALSLGETISDSIAAVGEQDAFTFTLASNSQLIFDSLTNDAQIRWSLQGRSGEEVVNRQLSLSDASSTNFVLPLAAGDYQLTIHGNGAATGDYAFRLLDLASAVSIDSGMTVSGMFDPGNEIRLYQFGAQAGEQLFFDALQSPLGYWRLIDPFGGQVFSNTFSDVGRLTMPSSGQYTLIAEGRISESDPQAHTFAIWSDRTIRDEISIGPTVFGEASISGDRDLYSIRLHRGQKIFFDSIDSIPDVQIRLTAPLGELVYEGSLNADSPLIEISFDGLYALTTDTQGTETGRYAFRIVDQASSDSINVDRQYQGNFSPVRQLQLFEFEGSVGQRFRLTSSGDPYLVDAATLVAGTSQLVTAGDTEDGYDAIDSALTDYEFREAAALNFVLITDEDRDILDSNLGFESVLAGLSSRNILLNGVLDASFVDGHGSVPVGVDFQGNAYLPDGHGGFTRSEGGQFVSGQGTTKQDYVDLAWTTGAAAWDLNQLRSGGLLAESFTQAFVEIKAREIHQQLQLDLAITDPTVSFSNQTGPLSGIAPGETATFDIQLTGDGHAHNFDVQFVRAGGTVIGTLPVTLNAAYHYPARAIDPEGDQLTFRLVAGPDGAVMDAQTGIITWIPRMPGVYSFEIAASDGRGGVASQCFDVTVDLGGPNEIPVVTSLPLEVATVLRPYHYLVTAENSDGDPLSFYFLDAPIGMSIDRTSGVISWTPERLQIGAHPVTVHVLDGRGGEAVQSFTIDVGIDRANSAPTIHSSPSALVKVGYLYSYSVVATDLDADRLQFDLPVKPKGMQISSTGEMSWIPEPNQVGTHRVILLVRDGHDGVDVQDFSITVAALNNAPVITSSPAGPATVGFPYEYRVTAQDADDDILDFQLDAAPQGMTIDQMTGRIVWSPTSNDIGTNSVAVLVRDARDGLTVQSFDLQVVANSTNEPPVVSSIPREKVLVGHQYRYQIVAADPNGDPLNYSATKATIGMTLDSNGLLVWHPSSDQFDSHDVSITVSDGRGGQVTQDFQIAVVTSIVNQPPRIVSEPRFYALIDEQYQYDARATDGDNDALFWELTDGPLGMSIDPVLGTVRWTPSLKDGGVHDVVITVVDENGGGFSQSYSINVRPVNLPPMFESFPPTVALVGQLYSYRVAATDPDSDLVAISLDPAAIDRGMTIDSSTGLIQWTPELAQVGAHNVRITAADVPHGATVNQEFSIVVSEMAGGRPPTFTSLPPFFATAGQLYSYAVVATDPEGQPVRLEVVAANSPQGMSFVAGTGTLEWIPTSSQLGQNSVSIVAIDPQGNVGRQNFSIDVMSSNLPPEFVGQVRSSVILGNVYRTDIRAIDPDGDDSAITFVLDSDSISRGLMIDPLGRIEWTPTLPDLGENEVAVTATDERGASRNAKFVVRVVPDSQPPQVSLSLAQNPVEIGNPVVAFANVTDDVGVELIEYYIDGVAVAREPNGILDYLFTTAGNYEIKVVATDASGNVGQASAQQTVTGGTVTDLDGEGDPPQLTFESLLTQSGEVIQIAGGLARRTIEITNLTQVFATITDEDNNLTSYTLSYAPRGEAFIDILRVESPLGETLSPLDNANIGTFDPTTLANGSYTLRLTAQDAGGNRVRRFLQLEVGGDLKIGNFTLSFTDLAIPVSGIPLTVSRTYDTLNANTQNHLGYGWRLEIQDANLQTSVRPTGTEKFGSYNAFYNGARVYVTLPGGRRTGFTFQPKLVTLPAGVQIPFYEPVFVPDPGVTSELSVSAETYLWLSGGGYSVSGRPYNPADPVFGGRFFMTTDAGISYEIDAASGQIRTVADTNNNTLSFTESGIISSTGKSITFERDPRGRITAVIDPMGNRVEYAYDQNGDLVGVIDRTGNQTTFAYGDPTQPHYLTNVIDPLGRSGIRTEYDDQGRMIRMIDSDGNPVELIHDPEHSIETVVDQLGNRTTHEYDTLGNVVKTVDAEGGVTTRTYNDPVNPTLETSITDPLNRTTTYVYDSASNVISQTDPLGNSTLLSYQQLTVSSGVYSLVKRTIASPTVRVDPLGNLTTYDYDASGNLLTAQNSEGQFGSLVYDTTGNPTHVSILAQETVFQHNAAGNVIRQQVEGGVTRTFSFDANGNQLTESILGSDSDRFKNIVSSHLFDGEGRVIKTTTAEDDVLLYVLASIYDTVGNRIAAIDGLGNVTKYVYDSRGLLIETILPDDTPSDDTDNLRQKTEYDAAGNAIAETDEAGRVVRYEYDGLGRQTKVILPIATSDDPNDEDPSDNPFIETVYDLAGQVVMEIDARGNATHFEYDAVGNRTTTILPDETPLDLSDNPRIFESYDASGRRISTTDPLGRVTQFSYTAGGLSLTTVYADSTSTSNSYDARRQLTARTDQNGSTTKYDYDSSGRLVAVVQPLGGWDLRTEYEYDRFGNLIVQRDASGREARFEYDGLRRPTKTMLPDDTPGNLADNLYSTTEYDLLGRVVSTTDFNGNIVQFEYDTLGHLIKKDFPTGTDVTYTYTTTGQRETVSDARGVTSYQYDFQDRLVQRVDPDGATISYTYDAAGNRTSVTTTVPGSAPRTTEYSYDAQNRPLTVTDPEGLITSYFYDAVGHLVRTELPNGTYETRDYNDVGSLVAVQSFGGTDQILFGIQYELDAVGNRTRIVEETSDGRRGVDYAYDELYRLVGETMFEDVVDPLDLANETADRIIAYVYDNVGNRLQRNDSAEGVTTYEYDSMDRLLSETLTEQAGDVVTITYSYDDNGNTVSKSTDRNGNPVDTVLYGWDYENRLIAVDTDGDGTDDIEYEYDAYGIRVSRADNGDKSNFLVDNNRPYAQVLEEYTPAGVIKVSYVHGLDLISQNRPAETGKSFYLVDGLGSTRALSDALGIITDRYVYKAFGQLIAQNGVTPNVHLFAGEQHDAVTELDYLRERYLSASAGRFLTRDTYAGSHASPMSMHRYLYANGNPALFIDPSGLFSISEQAAVEDLQGIFRSTVANVTKLFELLDRAESTATTLDLIISLLNVTTNMTDLESYIDKLLINESFQKYLTPNFFRNASYSLRDNSARLFSTVIRFKTAQIVGDRNLKGGRYYLYLPSPPTRALIPRINPIPIPKIKILDKPLVLFTNKRTWRLWGVGYGKRTSPQQYFRMDYGPFDHDNDDPNRVWRDGAYHYHVPTSGEQK